ncbi:HAD family hydrolase [Barnesiella propionica]|jgi:HAD hydrolase, family IA, variant 3|uniref:HAD family hydrolase n=1 Tax=Barnesiella propionica TaxID=2981781 RepID=UPI0021D109F0|nr:HAD family hydrolase [Barnesiella propionica]MCU6769263.1 HAD family hydrolase [Barnesiella propionica]
MMMDVKGIIFDYGGTIDSNGDHWSEVIWDGYQESRIPVNKEQFRNAYVYAERALARNPYIKPEHNFRDLLRIKMELELRNLTDEGYLDKKYRFFSSDIAEYCYNRAKYCVNNAKELICEIKVKYPVVLVSNFYGNIETVLKDFGLLGLFDSIIESAVVGVRKPDPAIFEMGVKALGLLPSEVVVVGDSYKKDICPAESLGCQAIWIKGKPWSEEENAVKHKNIITNFGQLRDFLL